MTEIEEEFDKAVCLLAVNSPPSFHLLSRMLKEPSDAIETMGVMVKNGTINLRYNPEFFKSLSISERAFVLIHEMLHVLLHHCTHRSSNDRARAYKENVAMDLAINCMIAEEPGISIPRFKKDEGKRKAGEVSALLPEMFGFPNLRSFEEYMSMLDAKYPDKHIKFVIKKKDVNGSDGSNVNNQNSGANSNNGNENAEGDIEIWDIDADCPIGKITKGRIAMDHGNGFDEDPFIDDMIRNAVENINRNNMWGRMGGGAVELIKKAQEQPLNWADILRLKIGPFVSFEKQPSRRRWNKHYGKPFLGQTTKSVEPVAVYADTSGSVGSADLSRFIVEIERIAHYSTVFFWSFDTDIKDPDEYVSFSRQTIDTIEFKGRGGTCFTPIFEHAKRKNISKIVILTDGYAEEIPTSMVEGMDVIWVITPKGNTKGKPGTVIEMRNYSTK